MDTCIIYCCDTLLQQKGLLSVTAVALVLDAIFANTPDFPAFVVLLNSLLHQEHRFVASFNQHC